MAPKTEHGQEHETSIERWLLVCTGRFFEDHGAWPSVRWMQREAARAGQVGDLAQAAFDLSHFLGYWRQGSPDELMLTSPGLAESGHAADDLTRLAKVAGLCADLYLSDDESPALTPDILSGQLCMSGEDLRRTKLLLDNEGYLFDGGIASEDSWTKTIGEGARHFAGVDTTADFLERRAIVRPDPRLAAAASRSQLPRSPQLAAQTPMFDGGDLDPGLWNHIESAVSQENWPNVASLTAIYLEDRVRSWMSDPVTAGGDRLVGKDLFVAALGDDGQLVLGGQSSERQGWMMLGMGFAQAVGNVVRHSVHRTADRRYAMGVVGLASLLLTEMRLEHPELPAAEGAPDGSG